MFDQLANIDTSRTTWKIKVRVTRMRPSISASQNLKGYNLILLDDNNCHVHAFVYAENWEPLSELIVEGGLYIFSTFYTKWATGFFRPTRSKIVINFSNSTKVEKLPADDFMIPYHKFDFIDLSHLYNTAKSYENEDKQDFSADVMGVLKGYENLKIINTTIGDRHIVRFRLTDGRNTCNVSVWGPVAVKMEEMYAKITERPVIAIVTSTKIKTYKTSAQLNTTPATKIYLNLDNDFVTAMRARLEEEGYQITEKSDASTTQTQEVAVIEKISVTELCEKTNTSDLKSHFMITVTITNVEENGNWWYLSCIGCTEEVVKQEGNYKCNCGSNSPVAEKRYKIMVLAGDETEALNFVLLDRPARRIIGQTATKLISDNMQSGASSGYPQKIRDMIGKKFTFDVDIRNDNVLHKSKIFYVNDAFQTATPSGPLSSDAIRSGICSSSFGESMVDLSKSGDTPTSDKSISKKIKIES